MLLALLLILEFPSIHFDWTFNIGNLTLIGIFLVLLRRGLPIYRLLMSLYAEHEMLLEDYANRNQMDMEEVKVAAIGKRRRWLRSMKAGAGK